jgi:Flp pilus assembly protein TadG
MSKLRRHQGERGQALVEFALVLPILATLILGIVQFGVVFHDYLALTDAVRAGARTGAVTHDGSRTTGAVLSSASELKPSDLAIDVQSSWLPGDDVTVTASYPYDISLLGVVVKSGRLNAKTTLRIE